MATNGDAEASGDCGIRVLMEESGVSKSFRQLTCLISVFDEIQCSDKTSDLALVLFGRCPPILGLDTTRNCLARADGGGRAGGRRGGHLAWKEVRKLLIASSQLRRCVIGPRAPHTHTALRRRLAHYPLFHHPLTLSLLA